MWLKKFFIIIFYFFFFFSSAINPTLRKPKYGQILIHLNFAQDLIAHYQIHQYLQSKNSPGLLTTCFKYFNLDSEHSTEMALTNYLLLWALQCSYPCWPYCRFWHHQPLNPPNPPGFSFDITDTALSLFKSYFSKWHYFIHTSYSFQISQKTELHPELCWVFAAPGWTLYSVTQTSSSVLSKKLQNLVGICNISKWAKSHMEIFIQYVAIVMRQVLIWWYFLPWKIIFV